MTIPRVPRAPHTSKQPEICPHCGGSAFTRRGTRKKKFEIVQLWRCASCKRTFTPGPPHIHHKTYPLRVIMEALTAHSLGYSNAAVITRVKARTGCAIAHSTLSVWFSEYPPLMTYQRLRERGRHRFPPEQTIRSIKLYHRQVYRYAFHRPKLEMLRQSDEHARFSAVANFLEAIPLICPHDLFRSEEMGGRASQAHPAFADTSHIIVNRKENMATRAAALVIPTVGDNRARHERLQQFQRQRNTCDRGADLVARRRHRSTRKEVRHRARVAKWQSRARHYRTHGFLAGAQRRGAHP
jgi:hypothetical protein